VEQDKATLRQRAGSIKMKKQILIGRYPSQNNYEDFVWGGSVF
jgi:hypothetical protein